MKKILVMTATVLFTMTGLSRAAHFWEDPGTWWSGHFSRETGTGLYFDRELTLDLFGSHKIGPDGGRPNHERWGGGVGLNYFFIKEFGIGADIVGSDNGGHLIDTASSSMIFRMVNSSPVAPYFYGGAGRTTDRVWEWFAQAGGGVEVRLNPYTGIFADGRWMFVNRLTDGGLIRAGLRLAF